MSDPFFGPYRLLELLGEGGMGQVYRAYDTATDRVVALKVLPPHESKNSTFQQRFRREAQTAAGLTDPHVVPIHGYGEIDGRLYLDMRLIEGRDLGLILKDSDQPLDPTRAVHYIEQVAEALNAAHNAGLVHRDIKPSNILITPRDFVYLIDFGIAHFANQTRLTSTGFAIGTFAYMAPERISAGESEPRSDVYALACVLHECLTGRPPFGGESVEQQIAGHLMTPPPRPSETTTTVPFSFDTVIEKGMAKEPDARYQSALELTAAAQEALDGSSRRSGVFEVKPPMQMAEHEAATQAGPTVPAVAPARVPLSPGPRGGEQLETRRKNIAVWIGVSSVTAVLAVIAIVIAFSIDRPNQTATERGGPPSSSPNTEATKATKAPTSAPPSDVGALPPFTPPADLGSNCTYPATPEPAAKPATPPRSGRVPTDPSTVSMTMVTNQGTLGLQLDNGKAPCTVNSFASLAQQGYFNNTRCHRLTTGTSVFVLQCGDPKTDGSGGPGYQFANEYPTNQYPPSDPALREPVIYPRGALAMANAGPGTNGSQFFVVYKDSELPPLYTVFGTIDENGMAVLDKIAVAGTADGSPDGKPASDVVIMSARLD